MKNLFLTIALFFGFLSGISQITTAEYFIDGVDPGVGNATPLTITSGNTVSENFTIPTTGLSVGLHALHIRVKDTNNTWSLYKRAFFYVQDNSGNNTTPQNITTAEYFIDTDPGAGNGQTLSLTQGLTVSENFSIPITGLSGGLHTLQIRVKDANNKWSLYKRSFFYVYPPNSNTVATPIVNAEYFFDTDPGVGNANAIAVTQGMTINENFTIIVPAGMTDGDHYLYIRVQDQDGNWSLYKRGLFTVDNSLSVSDFNSDNLKIYPNPVSDILHIDLTKSADLSIAVYDLNGREILKKDTLSLYNQVNTASLTSGIYFLKISDNTNDKNTILKFVKQ